jgi:hypothetical protein
MNTRTLFRSGLAAALTLTLAACDGASALDEDPEVIADDIEQANGGLDMEDEAPLFGDEQLFIDEELTDVETDLGDATLDTAIADLEATDGAQVYDVLLLVGHGDYSRDAEERDWDGEIEVNRGAVRVRRGIRFDRETDRVEPRDRDDLRRLRFRVRTRRQHAGLRLRVVDTDPTATDRFEIIYRDDRGEHRIDVDRLRERPETRDVDDRGHRIVATARRRRAANADPCDSGFLRGRWRQVAANYGVLRARISNGDELTGHMRGVYGERRDGSKVFFGKAIGFDGRFRGIFAGTYGNGSFTGRWLTRSGEYGVLGGLYRRSDRGTRGGHLIGRWAEFSCDD